MIECREKTDRNYINIINQFSQLKPVVFAAEACSLQELAFEVRPSKSPMGSVLPMWSIAGLLMERKVVIMWLWPLEYLKSHVGKKNKKNKEDQRGFSRLFFFSLSLSHVDLWQVDLRQSEGFEEHLCISVKGYGAMTSAREAVDDFGKPLESLQPCCRLYLSLLGLAILGRFLFQFKPQY